MADAHVMQLYHYFTETEQLVFATETPVEASERIAVYPKEKPLAGTLPIKV